MNKALLLLMGWLSIMLIACAGQDTAPASPSGLKAIAGDRSVQLEWSPNLESDLKGYVVSVTLADGVLVSNNPVAAPNTSVSVSDLTNGTVYSFRILAEDAAGNRSTLSSAVTATPGKVSVPPAKPSGFVASAQSEQVLLAWSKNSEPDLRGYTLYYGPNAANLTQSRTLNAGAVSVVVVGLLNSTPYFFALEAENNAGQKSSRTEVVSATPQANLAAPIISSYAISGYGNSTQVRQGGGGIEVVLQGQRLDTLTSAKLLGAFDFSISEKTPTSAKLNGTVPHGLELGTRTLLVSSGVGEAAIAEAIEITKITAVKTPQLNPNDTTGLGTPNRPFLTLTRALSAASIGDTVLLGAGIYSAGEVWSIGSISPVPPNVPSGITIEGQSSDRGAVLLQGPGANSQANALSLGGSSTIRNLTISGFNSGVRLEVGTSATRVGELRVENLALIENRIGLLVFSAERLELSLSALANNSNQGVLARGVRFIGLSQSTWTGNGTAINLQNNSSASSSATLNQLSVGLSSADGIYVQDVGLDVSNTRSFQNQGNGLILLGRPGFVALRSGTVLEQNGFQLYDERVENQGSFNATRFLLPGSGLTVGAKVGPTQLGNFYRIINAGNSILFQ